MEILLNKSELDKLKKEKHIFVPQSGLKPMWPYNKLV